MTICSAVFIIKEDNKQYKVKFLCTAEVRASSSSHPINRHYSITVEDSCIKTEYRSTENPTIAKAQHFVTKHIKKCIM